MRTFIPRYPSLSRSFHHHNFSSLIGTTEVDEPHDHAVSLSATSPTELEAKFTADSTEHQ